MPLTRRTSHQDLGYVLTKLDMVMHGWAGYFWHAIAKNIFSMLDNFTWRRVIRMLPERFRWNWTDVRRRYVTPTGHWLPVTADTTELRWIAAIPLAGGVPDPQAQDLLSASGVQFWLSEDASPQAAIRRGHLSDQPRSGTSRQDQG